MLMKKIRFFFTAVVLLVVSFTALAQNINVSGKVVDETGEPVVGASLVLVGNNTVYTMTDLSGAYSISVPSNGQLKVSCMGYQEKTVSVNGQKTLNIVLDSDSTLLDETIVVAFGTTTKEAFTGSATVVKSEDLQKRQTTNVQNALVGSVPGLQLKGASGAPGSSAGSINIRGIASMYAGTDPLIIVDGAPYTASLSNIPQNDIESITVLKDAASAALYGARGAAGVILVTTKKSKSKDAIVTFDAKFGVSSRAIQEYDKITEPGEYYEAYYSQLYNYFTFHGYAPAEANLRANSQMIGDLGYNIYTVPTGQNLIGLNGKLNPNAVKGRAYEWNGEIYYMTNDDWTDMAYSNASRQEYTVSVNGGNDRGSFYASVGYLDENGIIEYSGYKRFTSRVKADYQAKSWLKVGANIGFTNSTTDSNPNFTTGSYGATNLTYYTSMIAPIYPVYVRVLDANGNPIIRTDENGNPQYDYGVAATNYGVGRGFLQTGNPLGANHYNKVQSKGNQLNANGTAEVEFTPWLKANISSTIIWGNTRSLDYENALYGPKVGVNGEIYRAESDAFRQNHLQTLNFHNTYGDFNVNVLAGHEYYKNKSNSIYAYARGAFSPDILELSAFADRQVDASTSSSGYNVEGFFISAQADYKNKTYLSLSFRRDASSYFSKDHQWGNFWSIGLAEILNKESFLSDVHWIDILKLKASVGQQGNDSIGAWAYVDLYSLSKASDTSMSPTFYRLGNEKITWETTTNWNAGAEFSFWNGRLSGSLDVYYKKVQDLLFWLSIPESAGSRGYYGNIGDMSNKGIELSLTGSIIRTKNVDWSVSLNASHNATKILSLPDSKTADNGGFYESGLWYTVGGPMDNYMTYSYAGVGENGEAMYWYDEDLSPAGGKDGVTVNTINKPGTKKSGKTANIDEASRYALGSTLPKVFGGFSTTLKVGDFDFNATFDYQLGGKIYDSRYESLMTPSANASNAGSNFHKDWVKAWSATNTSSSIPRWQFADQRYGNDSYLTNASYLNFQSFAVGYNIPVKKIEGLNKVVNSIRLYAMGENLIFWSKRKGLDPRYSFTSNSSITAYSPVRTISGGIQLTF